MRILMLDNELPPLGGGMGTANLALLNQFALKTSMKIDQITSAIGGKREDVHFSEHIEIYKVPVWNRDIHHSSNRELIFYAVQAFFHALVLMRSRKYDFCFAWSAVPAGAAALALHGLTGLPYMVWASGPDIPGFELRYRNIYPIITPILRRIWRNADPLVVKCQEELDMIYAVEKELHIEIIPNGVDLTRFHPGETIPDDGPLRVVCSARLIERKGQHHLIEATKMLLDDDIDVLVELLGTGDALGKYQELTKKLGISEYVNFMGFVPRNEIADHYARAHIFVLPSYNEGMSLAALEAMASGLPVVLTRTGGTDELVEDGINGFSFNWGDVDALAAHIKYLATHRERAREMSTQSRERALQYSWDNISQRYLEIFANFSRNGKEQQVTLL